MLNRLSVSALLKTVILTTAFCIVIGFSLDAWESWKRLQMTSRISVVAEASASLFKAMHNLGTDGSTTNRLLNSDQPVDSVVKLLSKANPAVLVQEHGVVQGIVTRSDMLHFMMSR